MDIAEVVLRLTGPVDPVGESRMDEIRLENLRALCDVAGVLLDRIELVAEAYGDHMASVKAAKDHAAEFLADVRGTSPSQAPSFDVETMLRECVPAGSFFGSLKVADAIRTYCAAHGHGLPGTSADEKEAA